MKFYCTEKEEVLAHLETSEGGISTAEASKRLEQNGKNKLAAAKGKSIIRRFLEQLADPMIIILLVAAAISGVLAVLENENGESRLYRFCNELELDRAFLHFSVDLRD